MTKNKIIAGILVLGFLSFVFWWGGNAPSTRGWNPQSESSLIESEGDDKSLIETTPLPKSTTQPKATLPPEVTASPKATLATEVKASPQAKKQTSKNKDDEKKPSTDEATQQQESKSPYSASMTVEEKIAAAEKIVFEASSSKSQNTKSNSQETVVFVPTDTPLPEDADDAEASEKEYTCTLSIRCDTILNNLDWLPAQKHSLVPQDGVIFPEQTVTFCEGESVFDLLSREMKKNKIHLEFASTPVYKSVYIEGIANLYEFDCGALSGWMYKVNDWYPNYGSSRYQLKENDKVEWVYTCELGVDVGGYYGANNRTE